MERLYIAGSLFNEAEVNQRMYILRSKKGEFYGCNVSNNSL